MAPRGAPLVSVCIPSRNRAGYLTQALESVLAQSLQDFEIIVYDDASEDETEDAVRRVGDTRIRLFRHEHAVGIPANRNSCLAAARGRYVAWLDSDDLYLPAMLATQTAVLDRHPDVGLVHGAFHVIDGSGRRLSDWPRPFAEDVVEPGARAFAELCLRNYISAPTVLVRRECHERAGPYATGLGATATDWDMWMRIALRADLAYSAVPVSVYRYHAGGITQADRSDARLRCEIAVVEHVFQTDRPLIPDADRLEVKARNALAVKAFQAAGEALARGDRGAARGNAALGIELAGSRVTAPAGQALVESIDANDEFECHRAVKRLLADLAGDFTGTRFANRLSRAAHDNLAWQQTLSDIADVVREIVPHDLPIATVDKWDPTIRHLSGRQGCHFPDPHLLPGGYPADSATAIAHLEQLRARGVRYLVFSSAAFWWLEHYQEFGRHLDHHYARVWTDANCVIYAVA